MQPEELAASVDTLSSSAAEGELLAGDVAEDRTKATFARVHARDLGNVVDHEAEKLADATPQPGIADENAGRSSSRRRSPTRWARSRSGRAATSAPAREAQRQLSQLAEPRPDCRDSL